MTCCNLMLVGLSEMQAIILYHVKREGKIRFVFIGLPPPNVMNDSSKYCNAHLVVLIERCE